MSSLHQTAIDRPFSLRREDAGGVTVVVVDGEVDMVTAPAIQQEFELIAPGTCVVVDLCDVPFMDSTGLRVLLAARQALDGRVHIACLPGGPVARLFKVAPVPELLKVFPDARRALAAFPSPLS